MIEVPNKIVITEAMRKEAYEANKTTPAPVCCPIYQALRGPLSQQGIEDFEVGSEYVEIWPSLTCFSEHVVPVRVDLSSQAAQFVYDWDQGYIPVEGPDLELVLRQ